VDSTLNDSADIQLSLYNLQGKLIYNFAKMNTKQTAGRFNETLQLPSELPSGLYLLRIGINGKLQNTKVSVIR